mmetsp:Transcript_9828/g.25834  ORF Transcript_9828/g.25834 Transcript_9828/m.25834 type:complete len:102 (-) Transcript_9828:932-1237(-)
MCRRDASAAKPAHVPAIATATQGLSANLCALGASPCTPPAPSVRADKISCHALHTHVAVITESVCEAEMAQFGQSARQQKRYPFTWEVLARPSQSGPTSQP